jgi:quinoprotein glucose dehydrogenase|tara:strand:- start:2448 stop:4415 length:1968 start_codon:yes stop_codon:yes gene_type:complete
MSHRIIPGLLLLLAIAAAISVPGCTRESKVEGQWQHHGGDHASSKYSGLDQIDADDFSQLAIAWRWRSADHRLDQSELYYTGDYRATPLMVGDSIYTATSHGQVVALNAASGEELWLYDPQSYKKGRPVVQPLQTRGIEFWRDGEVERIFIATPGKQLISIDIRTGLPDPQFGNSGIVDLNGDLGPGDFDLNYMSNGAPPIAVGDTVIVGSKLFDYSMTNNSPPGHVRAYDARTGRLKWRFHTIPRQGEEFSETWEHDAWKKAGNTNVWTMMAADDELGYVYLPTATPANDYWGGERHGANVFAESLVCLDADTGKRIWHFQTVHHGVWDYDIPAAPNLIDITVGGQLIHAVAQVSKTGFTYVFDRVTGVPIWPIEERAVPQSNVPGEKTFPTQPYPTRPAPFERLGISIDDLIDFTPELRAEAIEITKGYKIGPMFTPPIVKDQDGKLATIVVPGAGGGANFPGASIDPETGILYVESSTRPTGMALIAPAPDTSDWRYVISYQPTRGPRGLPLLKPPYRRITAIDLNSGEHAWQIPFGQGPTQHDAIKHLQLGPLGSSYTDAVAEGGILVTKTLLITYISKADEHRDATKQGSYLRAYNKSTGEFIAQVDVESRLHGAPITYLTGGRQYIAIAAGGRAEPQELVAFALPVTQL